MAPITERIAQAAREADPDTGSTHVDLALTRHTPLRQAEAFVKVGNATIHLRGLGGQECAEEIFEAIKKWQMAQ